MTQDTLALARAICKDRRLEIGPALGRGAVGEVFLVHRGGAPYALKVLGSDSLPGSESFEREMRALVDHPNPYTVRIYEFGVTPAPWYLMDHYDASLADWIARHPDRRANTKEASRFLADALAGLAEWHGRLPRVLHGDINPGNILVNEASGHAVLADPSLAALRGPRGTDLTGGDLSGGTPGYANMLVGPRTVARDVYAMGATIYATLSRTVILPATGLADRVRGDAAISEPERGMILAALSESESDRPADARALLAVFQNVDADRGPDADSDLPDMSEPMAHMDRLSTASYVLGAAALMGLIVLGLWLGDRGPTVASPQVTAASLVPAAKATSTVKPQENLAQVHFVPPAPVRVSPRSVQTPTPVLVARTTPPPIPSPSPSASPRVAQRLAPPTAWQLFDQARLAETRGDRQRAQDLYRRSAAFDETRPNANRALGLLYFRIGAFAGAADHLERYLSLRPEAPDRQEIERIIDRARS